MSFESVMPSNHLILCSPLLLLSSIFPSIRVFSREMALLIKWPKYWSFSFSPSFLPMNIQGWFPLRLLVWSCCPSYSKKSSPAPQFKSINSFVLCLLYGPTLTFVHDYWKIIALIIWISVSKEMSLLYNMQSRSVIAFLLRSKHFLISCLQSWKWISWNWPSAVILEPKKIKLVTVSTFSHLFAMKLVFWCHDLSFLNVEF